MNSEGWRWVSGGGAVMAIFGLADLMAGEIFPQYENNPTMDIVLLCLGVAIAAYASRKNHRVGESGCSLCGGPINLFYSGYGFLCYDCARKTNFSEK
jgi:hypothetical protein